MSRTRKYAFVIILATSFALGISILAQVKGQVDDQPLIVVETPKPLAMGRVVAIRRVNLVINDTLPSGEGYERRVPHVEIDLDLGEPDFGTNLFHLVQIGGREFVVFDWKTLGEGHTATVRMTAKEFDSISDGSEIFYRVGDPIELEQFGKLREAGKLPSDRLNAGKLSKRMIDLEPTVEKSAGWKPEP